MSEGCHFRRLCSGDLAQGPVLFPPSWRGPGPESFSSLRLTVRPNPQAYGAGSAAACLPDPALGLRLPSLSMGGRGGGPPCRELIGCFWEGLLGP